MAWIQKRFTRVAMHKDLKSIDVVYENCEVTSIPAENIDIFDITLGDRWMWHNFSCKDKHNNPYIVGHTCAKRIWLCVKLKGLSEENKGYLRRRKDITHIDIMYADGTHEYVRVPEPFYFYSWLPNPYQITYIEYNEEGGQDYEAVDIRIEKHWSLLSIKQGILDYLRQCKHAFPRGLLLLLEGYWESFKRHFRCRH